MSTPLEVRMPRLSESMVEGTIVAWLHAAGAEVERGEDLAEIETDKATVTFEADASGVLEILAGVGETLPVGAVIARVGGGATSSAEPPPVPAAAPPPAPAAPRVPASPLARRRARELGVELAGVPGTGPGGRVVRADIEQAARAVPPADADPRGPVTVVRPSRARQLAAGRMATSAREVPAFALTAEIDMAGCVELRERIAALPGDGPVPTVTDLVVAAAGRALRAFPLVNATYRDGTLALFGRVNVGVAVDTPDALLVPVVTDADSRSLPSIAARTRELAGRARDGRIGPAELDGATFTVSNLGMFGVTEFEAVINPPQAAILAVGAQRDLPRVVGGQVRVRPVMAVTLSCDHRVLDGAEGARFLGRIVELLEQPLALLLEP